MEVDRDELATEIEMKIEIETRAAGVKTRRGEESWLCVTNKCSMMSTILKPLSAQSALLRNQFALRVASLATASLGRALALSLSRRTCCSCQNADRHPSGKISLPRALRVRARFLRWLSRGILDPNALPVVHQQPSVGPSHVEQVESKRD